MLSRVKTHSGAWSPSARKLLQRIAVDQAAAEADHERVTSLRIAQRFSIALHRANARAVFRRLPAPQGDHPTSSGWDVDVEPTVDEPHSMET